MTAAVPRCTPDASLEEVEGALRDAGCVVVERVADDTLMDTIAKELEPFLHATAVGCTSPR